MRKALAVLTGAASLAASAALLASPAQAYRCPGPLLENEDRYVAGQRLPGCKLGPFIQCDPDPCTAVRL